MNNNSQSRLFSCSSVFGVMLLLLINELLKYAVARYTDTQTQRTLRSRVCTHIEPLAWWRLSLLRSTLAGRWRWLRYRLWLLAAHTRGSCWSGFHHRVSLLGHLGATSALPWQQIRRRCRPETRSALDWSERVRRLLVDSTQWLLISLNETQVR